MKILLKENIFNEYSSHWTILLQNSVKNIWKHKFIDKAVYAFSKFVSTEPPTIDIKMHVSADFVSSLNRWLLLLSRKIKQSLKIIIRSINLCWIISGNFKNITKYYQKRLQWFFCVSAPWKCLFSFRVSNQTKDIFAHCRADASQVVNLIKGDGGNLPSDESPARVGAPAVWIQP